MCLKLLKYKSLNREATALIPRTAHEDAASANRSAIAASRKANKICADDYILVRPHVPESKCTVRDIDAIAVGAFVLFTRIGCDYLEANNIDVPAPHLVACKNLNTAGRR